MLDITHEALEAENQVLRRKLEAVTRELDNIKRQRFSLVCTLYSDEEIDELISRLIKRVERRKNEN